MEPTETEILTRINSLKIKHELLKKELTDLITTMEIKEKELIEVENEYGVLISKMIK